MSADHVRAVIEAARAVRRNVKETGEEPDPERTLALWSAVDALEDVLTMGGAMPNVPTGFVLTRPWELVPAGWFVRVPSGEWFEVVETKRNGTTQDVTLKSPKGATGSFPRPCLAEVKVRRGSNTKELDDAIEALSDLFGGVQVLSDKVEEEGPPW
jgi:hypothetical protein